MSSGRRVFITGGASGLGLALARHYAGLGWSVCIGDLDEERCQPCVEELKSLGAKRAAGLACDVTSDEAFEAAAAWLKASWGGVDVVINNAGVAQGGRVEDVSTEDWRWVLEINLIGVARGCRTFIPVLREGGGGHIINIASMAGLTQIEGIGAYGASKAGVIALSETLTAELAHEPIGISVVCPAFFHTNLDKTARATNDLYAKRMSRLVGRSRITAESIAAQIIEGVERGDFMILTHRDSEKLWWLKRFAPYKLYLRTILAAQAKLQAREQQRASETTTP